MPHFPGCSQLLSLNKDLMKHDLKVKNFNFFDIFHSIFKRFFKEICRLFSELDSIE